MISLFWLFFNLITIVILAFYSMSEMACVSLNRVRLHYYVSKGNQRAIWLQELLNQPSKLFGTTLIGVNAALVIGSEASREFHQSLGISPDFAPLSQVVLVVIFGELAPMFAARHYSEHVAMLSAPLLYASSVILAPFIWILTLISRTWIYLFHGHETDHSIFISKEELLKIIESKGEEEETSTEEEFDAIASNIFNLRYQNLRQVMTPLKDYPKMSLQSSVDDVREKLKSSSISFLPLYQKDMKNIHYLVYPRDLLRAKGDDKAKSYGKTPWFVAETTSLVQILHQFRNNNESVAVILNKKGHPIGFVKFDDVLEKVLSQNLQPISVS